MSSRSPSVFNRRSYQKDNNFVISSESKSSHASDVYRLSSGIFIPRSSTSRCPPVTLPFAHLFDYGILLLFPQSITSMCKERVFTVIIRSQDTGVSLDGLARLGTKLKTKRLRLTLRASGMQKIINKHATKYLYCTFNRTLSATFFENRDTRHRLGMNERHRDGSSLYLFFIVSFSLRSFTCRCVRDPRFL